MPRYELSTLSPEHAEYHRRSHDSHCPPECEWPGTGQSSRFVALAEGVEDMRETLGAMVAGVMTDGFTEDQARAIVAGFFASMVKNGDGA